MDVMSKRQRSHCMSRIRGKNTSPEIQLRKLLHKAGLRFRVHRSLPGRPDVVLVKKKIAVFIDGCFWHGCRKHCQRPAANKTFWNRKIDQNMVRDKRVNRLLRQEGWRVLRIWEHQLKEEPQKAVQRVVRMAGKLNPRRTR